MELIPRDGRIVALSHVAKLAHERAELVVRLYRGEDSIVRRVHAELIVQRVEQLCAELLLVVVNGGGTVVERHVHHRHEKPRVVLLHKVEYFKVFMPAVHHLARLG